MRFIVRIFALAFAAIACSIVGMAAPAQAGDIGDTVQIHGYGGWAYKRLSNSGYVYNDATHEGNYTNVTASLNVSARPADRLFTVVQARWLLHEERTPNVILLPNPSPFALPGEYAALPNGTVSSNPASEVELDYAFAEWAFNDTIRLRAGQVKLPFGLYTEIWDVGTLRPFLDLPQGLYGGQAIVAEAYQGGGLTGSLVINDQWSILYDAYIGQVISDTAILPTYIVESRLSDVFGGRLILTTPIDGFTAGVSAYGGLRSDALYSYRERGSVGVYFDYSTETLIFRGEAVYNLTQGVVKVVTGYAELAYLFADHVQLAARADLQKGKLSAVNKLLVPSTIDVHQDYGAALNYWFSPNFVIKTEYHYVRGNRFSQPVALLLDFVTPYAGPPLDDTNHVFEAGAQFSF